MGRMACTETQCLYSRAIPLLPLRAVQPVQSLSACTRVHFTFTFTLKVHTHVSMLASVYINYKEQNTRIHKNTNIHLSRCKVVVIIIFNYALQPLRLTVRSGLDVPTFATKRLHACYHARAPSGGRWNCGQEMSGKFA
jgi:hypothetical protein